MTMGSKLIAVDANETDEPAVREENDLTQDVASAEPVEVAWIDETSDESIWDEDDRPARMRRWLTPTLATLAIAGWTGFFGWVHHREIVGGASSVQWSEWAVSWAVPVLLVIAIYLLTLRTSAREARRFGDMAAMLSDESTRLETQLVTVNRELALAREFLSAETRELETLGRVAADRLSDHAERLQSLVTDNGTQIESIAAVSTNALANMEQLRGDLPVVANAARDVSNQIGNAGRTAHGQLGDMVRGFERLNEFGQASENQVAVLSERIESALTGFQTHIGQIDQSIATRLNILEERHQAFVVAIENREADAQATMQDWADTLRSEVETARRVLKSSEEEALDSLDKRLASLQDRAATIGGEVHEQQEAALGRWGRSIGEMQGRLTDAVQTLARIDEQALNNSNAKLNALLTEADAVDAKLIERDEMFETKLATRRERLNTDTITGIDALDLKFAELDRRQDQLRAAQHVAADQIERRSVEAKAALEALHAETATLADQTANLETRLTASAEQLVDKLTETRLIINGADGDIAQLTEGSVRLLELIRGAAERSREDLPQALGDAEARLTALGEGADEIRTALVDAAENGRSLSEYLVTSKDEGREASEVIADLHVRLAEAGTDHANRLETLRDQIEEIRQESDSVSAATRDNLSAAIAVLEEAVRKASENLSENTVHGIAAFAEQVGNQAAVAVEKALCEKSEAGVAALEDRSARAAAVSREAAVQLRDQLVKVNELAGNLETRVNRARERAQEQVDNDFSRRVALITECLNSNAIDIAKALSSEVTDTSWASYLRGDRGIFTRRVVKLIDSAEARDIAEIYDTDSDFREHASRYIHDFEAMLRTMLSTRDGNALGVTLLSSDMGKLYVALAQALDRLRED